MQGIVGGLCRTFPNHARVRCSGHGWALTAVKVHGNGGIFSLAFPTECFGTEEGLNPIEWESGREFRHRLGCDTRCTAAAMCSIHVAGSLHVLWDTEDAWKEEIQRPTFFLYNIHILVSSFHQRLEIFISFQLQARLTWSDRTFTP